ncbi:MAG: copper chaperone PCu(A)C [Salinisphaera sp.]|jgi:copper(I)-binding protein|nr:copper chaperone PCu(A)C [Salinisphaera sp.]
MRLRLFYGGRAICVSALLLTVAACSSSTPAANCGRLKVSDAWVRPAHLGSREMAGYFTLSNQGASDVVVNGVSSTQFARAVFQKKSGADGHDGVQRLEDFTVTAGKTMKFAPGGREVALYSPTQSYDPGDQVEIVLACGSDQAKLAVPAVVRAHAGTTPSVVTSGDTDADTREQIIRDARDGGGASAADDSKTAN